MQDFTEQEKELMERLTLKGREYLSEEELQQVINDLEPRIKDVLKAQLGQEGFQCILSSLPQRNTKDYYLGFQDALVRVSELFTSAKAIDLSEYLPAQVGDYFYSLEEISAYRIALSCHRIVLEEILATYDFTEQDDE